MTNHAILSAIENELVRVENHVAQLRQKIHALSQDATTTLHMESAEAAGTPVLPVDLTPRGAFHPRGFLYRGIFHRCSTQIDIYIGLLRAIASGSQNAMARTAAALKCGTQTRSFLATCPTQLFKSQTPDWAAGHSRRVIEGWYADTNLSLQLKKKLIRRILRANDLREGSDVVIVWAREKMNDSHFSVQKDPTTIRNH